MPTLLHYAHWIPDNSGIVWHILVHHSICSDNNIITDPNLAKNHRTSSDVRVISYYRHTDVAKVPSYRHILTNSDVLSYCRIRMNHNAKTPITDAEIGPNLGR